MRVRTHPGEVLAEEFLKPLKLSANALGRELGVPANRISEIVNGSRALTADTACGGAAISRLRRNSG